ncbi:X-X-X-Leu-X-X-Gly heptad repeat protein [Gracilibacillus halotolerans]|uniref:X-X-X-Leu-X-X-Gly heptad repeat protein n=1 Tax=Gracilibacillus halotolerans TaxID=74386 RepID=A0A841RKK8_9BACI|nr:YhgE/Pip domain-containing protein [Gracilibacillus halotolerans]MBB6513251.1 X-X-X-Leu-X-X-Gly heptad repeat protein [Gracilibacillus halotolerans]
MKRIFSMLICLMLVTMIVSPVYAEDIGSEPAAVYENKDEVIYVNLTSDGQTNNMYVVNGFQVTEPGKIIDYGEYNEVKNLTSLAEIEQNNDEVRFLAEEGEFYYQGTFEKSQLPWDISIRYFWNGEEVNPKEKLGESGKLKIEIQVNQNEENSVFNDYYLLQIGVTTEPEKVKVLQSENGTIANVGEKEQITYTVMPGQDERFTIEAEANNFELAPIEINALPANIAVEKPDTEEMTEDITTLSDAIASIDEGVGDLQTGLSELEDGLGELNDGSSEFYQGIEKISASSNELTNASNEIKNALHAIDQSLSGQTDDVDFSALGQLRDGLKEMKEGLGTGQESLKPLKDSYEKSLDALETAIWSIPDSVLKEEEINSLLESNADPNIISELLKTYEAAKQIQYIYDETQAAFQAVPTALSQMDRSLLEVSGALDEMITGLDNLDSQSLLDGINQLQQGIRVLSSNYDHFHDGLVEYTDGIDTVASSYGDIDKGIHDLHNGTMQISDGVGELKDGTSELASETTNMPQEMEQEVEKMLEEFDFSDYEPVSFISDKNEKIRTVQFVMKTEELIVEEKEEVAEEAQQEQKSFWQKFLDLFR